MKIPFIGLLTFFCFGLISNSSFSQNFDYSKKTKSQAFKYELTQKGILIDSIKSYGIVEKPLIDSYKMEQTKVYIFKRTTDAFKPQLHVWYHYDKNGKIRGIKYNWGLYNPSFNSKNNRTVLINLSKKEKEFTAKYNNLKKGLDKKFGKTVKVNEINTDHHLGKMTFWEDKEKVIFLLMKFDRKIVELRGFGPKGDYEIYEMITYK